MKLLRPFAFLLLVLVLCLVEDLGGERLLDWYNRHFEQEEER
jgi:hypothetical protein